MPSHDVQDLPSILVDFALAQRRRGLMPSTIRRRQDDIMKFVRWYEPGLLAADATAIEAFIDSRPQWEPVTIYAFLSNLHMFYVYALRKRLVTADPTADIDRPRLHPGVPRPIADDDLAYLIRQADTEMRAWLLLGAFQGLRCAEIAGLRRGDVNETTGYLRVMGKGRKERIVPLHPWVLSSLRRLPMPRQGHLFHMGNGRPMTPTRASQRINGWMDLLGVDATAHQLRHWFGTETYRACQDILAVAGLMGHANTAMTQRYAAFSNEVALAAVHALHLDLDPPEAA